MEPEKLEIKFHLFEIGNKFMRQLGATINAVKHSYHAVLNYEVDEIPPLETNTVPVVIINEEDPTQNSPTKDATIDWLLKKAFEELIIGLTESLVYAHEALKIRALSKTTSIEKPGNKKQILEEIERAKERARKLPFPVLISEIEKELGMLLPYRVEVVSINQVRNCLVHRAGTVSEKDINEENTRSLKLTYSELATYVVENNQLVEADFELRKREALVTGIGHKERVKEVEFGIQTHVKINQNIFNGVSFSCLVFTRSLMELIGKAIGLNFDLPPINFG